MIAFAGRVGHGAPRGLAAPPAPRRRPPRPAPASACEPRGAQPRPPARLAPPARIRPRKRRPRPMGTRRSAPRFRDL